MRILLTAALAAAALLPAPAAARACSDGGLVAQQIGLDQYDPAGLTNVVVQVSLRLSSDCELNNLALTPRNERTFAVRGPGGELASRRLPSTRVQVSNPVRTILSRDAIAALEAGETIILDLLELRAGQFIAPGAYLLDLDVVTNGRAAAVLPIAIRVSAALQLVGDAAAGSMNVELGDIGNGARAERAIYLRANTRLGVQVASEHGGLRHQADRALGVIPYQLFVDGVPVEMGSPRPVKLSGSGSKLTMTTIDVRVAPTRNRFAGRYSDVLTFSFVAD